VDPGDLPGALKSIQARAATAAPPVAMAMGRTYQDRVKSLLRLRSHPFGEFVGPAPGIPPAWMTGRLSMSVRTFPGASSGLVASSFVRPNTVYAAVQEYGANIFARPGGYMHWRNTGGQWWKKHVYIRPHPYMRPALSDVVADGSLSRSAVLTFKSVTGL
jgi:hypothetical protein